MGIKGIPGLKGLKFLRSSSVKHLISEDDGRSRLDPDEPRPEFSAPTKQYFPEDDPDPQPEEKSQSDDES
jgi:hypothetical protein